MIYAITGWQADDVPHWHIAYVEAQDEDSAKAALLTELLADMSDNVWGWSLRPNDERDSYHDPSNWKISEAEHPFLFILGGGCR